MFVVNTFIDRKLSEEELQYTRMDNDLTYDDLPAVFSNIEKAMDYVKGMEDPQRNVYCMVFEEKLDYPFDIPVAYNGKFASSRNES